MSSTSTLGFSMLSHQKVLRWTLLVTYGILVGVILETYEYFVRTPRWWEGIGIAIGFALVALAFMKMIVITVKLYYKRKAHKRG